METPCLSQFPGKLSKLTKFKPPPATHDCLVPSFLPSFFHHKSQFHGSTFH